jgi:hypothetical protein
MGAEKKQKRPYVTVTIDFYDHPKTKRLAKSLGVNVGMAGYHLQRLWMWAWRFAPEGDLVGVSEDEIADAAGLKRTDAVLKLVLAGWLDSIDGGYAIHDWFEHSGRAFEEKRKHRDYMREVRAKAKGCELTVNSRELTVNSRELTVNSRERPTTTTTTTTTEEEIHMSVSASPIPTPPSSESFVRNEAKEPAPASKRPRQVPKVPSDGSIAPEAIKALWNETRPPSLSAISTLEGKRLKTLQNRLKQFPAIEEWRTAIRNLSSSAFHCGEGFRADFDWLLSEKGIRCFEGPLGSSAPKPTRARVPTGSTYGAAPIPLSMLPPVERVDFEAARAEAAQMENTVPKRRKI